MKLSPSDKALLISITGASLLVLVFFFLGVQPYQGEIAEEFIEIPILTEELAPEIKEEIEPQPQQNTRISHQVYNSRELRKETKSFEEEDAIRQAIAERQLGSVEHLNKENDAHLSDVREKQLLALAEKKEQVQAAIDAREAARNKRKQSSTRQSTVSYDLEGRTAIKIPNPVYTCDATGIITIDITVSANGTIIKKEYNKRASSSTNGCLIDQAMKYLGRAYFDDGVTVTQKGTVTYNFQG